MKNAVPSHNVIIIIVVSRSNGSRAVNLTLVAEVDSDVFLEIEPVHDGPEQVGNHTGALYFDAQVVVARLKVIDLRVSSDHVQRLEKHRVQQHKRRDRRYFEYQLNQRFELKSRTKQMQDAITFIEKIIKTDERKFANEDKIKSRLYTSIIITVIIITIVV